MSPMSKKITSYIIIIAVLIGGFVFWQLYQQHQQNIKTGDQMMKNADKMR